MIVFDHVSKTYPDGTMAVEDLSFTAPNGKITVLVGPSGCGKTTSMRMINRLIDPTSGTITLDGQPTAGIDKVELRRKIGYVIQNAGLFPHRTVVDNVAALPRLLGERKQDARDRARQLLNLVGLDESFARKYPWQLSGGQQQRVGVARALATDPPFLLMDEPFSAVDPIVRAQLQDEFLKLQETIGKTIVMVTHDIDEALILGDQIAVLRQGGRLAQIASPEELLRAPADRFVADFVGTSRGYRSLGFIHADEQLTVRHTPAAPLGSSAAALPPGSDGWLVAVDEQARPLGWIHRERIGEVVTAEAVDHAGSIAAEDAPLRDLLDAALSSPSGDGIVAGADGGYLGTVGTSDIVAAIQRSKRGRARPADEEAGDRA
ncbi:ABC transporter ATP-binding protein [Sediminivirga luteola]|uniref:ABC-type quaternary amine transporter n=1 Tax=Sediminivirga luteola TaxID=1774748 RepID=A0A8J2XB88_9MICO|nr:ATP-binding cassette domain-containing protein [Sediminivirga luteola]MCI2264663.1 ATP-binding cassette domain-containing protein [Sediminivirga luteola]GGA02661.1 proline/glycine betaine ABC transporter ATP-binding protein [Sediminivirga luteola]